MSEQRGLISLASIKPCTGGLEEGCRGETAGVITSLIEGSDDLRNVEVLSGNGSCLLRAQKGDHNEVVVLVISGQEWPWPMEEGLPPCYDEVVDRLLQFDDFQPHISDKGDIILLGSEFSVGVAVRPNGRPLTEAEKEMRRAQVRTLTREGFLPPGISHKFDIGGDPPMKPPCYADIGTFE
jgi:hypothetical protein